MSADHASIYRTQKTCQLCSEKAEFELSNDFHCPRCGRRKSLFLQAFGLSARESSPDPVAVVAETHLSRYTLEWVNGPVPEGTKLYAVPPDAAAQIAELERQIRNANVILDARENRLKPVLDENVNLHKQIEFWKNATSNASKMVAERNEQIAKLEPMLTECRSSVKFDLLHYEKMAIAYGKLAPEGKQTHEMAESEANRLRKLLDDIDGLTETNGVA